MAPSGTAAKLRANLDALATLRRCQEDDRWADPGEQAVLARWSGWGAVPQVFDDNGDRLAAERAELRRLLRTEAAWAQDRRTTLNAHYTSAAVVQAMWGAAAALGVDGPVRVLEPGCGSGNFLGFAPGGARLTGIELDETTAAIAQHLYGAAADIHVGPFEDLRVEDGAYDLVIGNVPFAKVTPHDPRHNRGRHALHNYFLVKSLRLTRPGGLVLALTSRYTLDARNPAARREMASLADLVGAVRLPERAFARSSGTDVVTDLLVLRRRPSGAEPTGPAWTRVEAVDLAREDGAGGPPLEVNEYFTTHPERVLGRLAVARGMYRDHELTVLPDGDLDAKLLSALVLVAAGAHDRGLAYVPAVPTAERPQPIRRAAGGDFDLAHAQDGSFVVNRRGEVAQLAGGRPVRYEPRFAKDRPELARLVGLRDAARSVLAVQLRGGSDDDLRLAQAELADRYTAYARIYGPINRSTQARTGRRHPETRAEVMRRVRPRMGGFREDPDWPLVAALEVFDEDTQNARPAAIFHERVVDPPHERHGVDTADEAVAVCLDETGAVTLDRVAELLGVDHESARAELGELVYDEPGTGRLVPAAEYLSGNVRQKLDACRAAAIPDGHDYAANIAALERVLPRQLEPGEITARPGSPWIPSRDVERFCSEVLGATVDVEHLAELGHWTARLRESTRRSVALTSEWETARADAITLLDAALNQRLHTVSDPTDDGRRVRNDAETLAARDKQEALSTRFAAWVWEDPDRAERLAATYNALFCSTVLPEHDGGHLTLPGLAAGFTPRVHQRAAVARILTDGRALLAHAVGAGKTATMVTAAMELRRLGSASKPAVVVPNHMLEQFSREWLQLYPTARILVADRERLSRDRRKEFVARAATGDWDGIVFTQSGFARIPLGSDLMTGYLGEEIETMRRVLAGSKEGKGLAVKRLERRIAQMEETYKRLLAQHTKDDGVRFEETGIDYLFVDEAHAYKNRRVDSSIDGVANGGSQRAQDLDSKLWALRWARGHRVVTFATATPVANSMAELWVMQSYLHPDLLESVGLRPFDAWAATFGRTHTALELAPDGASYRMQTRFARFQNVPELLTLYRQVADVRTSDDLDLPVPAVAGGQLEIVVVEPSGALRDYVTDLAERAEAIRNRAVDPAEDNMLKVTGDGRRAALDLRLVGGDPPTGGGRLAAAAQRIAAVHHATRDNRYEDEHGQLTLRPGALQLVFCDVSTPASDGWNAYDELRSLLVRRGVDPDAIRYMQDAKTDAAKAALFAACRDGSVAVLVGSTETMGVGTNVQARVLLTAPLPVPRGWGLFVEVVMEAIRRALLAGQVELPTVGEVRAGDGVLAWVVVDGEGCEIEPFSAFLRDLALSDASPLTGRSYGHDLLRWWRLLGLVAVPWDRATRSEVELLVGWLRNARNPQRDRKDSTAAPAGSVNLRTGKPTLRAGYAPSTINHALTVLSAFYAFHLQFGRGPMVNPVPIAVERRWKLAHRSPIEPQAQHRRAPLRQKMHDRPPRSIPDELWDELFEAMGNNRDRALLAFYVSSGARATELLGVCAEHIDWAAQRVWVISKGSRSLDAVPGSPEAFRYLALYLDEHGTPAPGDQVWRTLRGDPRPLTYWAMRRVLQRANELLGTNWTLHDLRHTAAARMAADPQLTLPEVQTVLRHRQMSTTERYLQPHVDEVHDKLQEHFNRPRPQRRFAAGYDPDDFRTVFGG